MAEQVIFKRNEWTPASINAFMYILEEHTVFK